MVVSTVLLAWWRWDDGIFGIGVLVAIAVLALIGEIIDFFAGTGGARRAGAGWGGALAAIGGMICGVALILIGLYLIYKAA
jgi:uncharacterized protein YqgC (DUF456 family)